MTDKTELAALLEKHNISGNKAAIMLGKHPVTVYKWRAGIEPTPQWAIELLTLKLDKPP